MERRKRQVGKYKVFLSEWRVGRYMKADRYGCEHPREAPLQEVGSRQEIESLV